MKGSTITFSRPMMTEEHKENQRKAFEEVGGYEGIRKARVAHFERYNIDEDFTAKYNMIQAMLNKQRGIFKSISDSELDKIIEKVMKNIFKKFKQLEK